MPAKVRSTPAALKLLAKRMGYKVGKGNALTRSSDGLRLLPKPSTKQLAMLAWIAMRQKPEALEAIEWTGKVPSKGIAMWEQEALERLQQSGKTAAKRPAKKARKAA